MAHQPDLFAPREPRIYTVSEINDAVRRVLDDCFGEVAVEGEISNAKRMPSGHWYFTLKDESAQIAAVLFRSDAAGLRFRLENGLCVRVAGRLNIYAPQGKFQIQARSVHPVGQGALELAFRQLKEKLQAEGLFDNARKRPLPRFPTRVALVTSPNGAAVRDMLTTLATRWPLAAVVLVPVAVQGDTAPEEIVRGLRAVDRRRAADVVILGRGGGSLEDLWPFNEEVVARAVVESGIPVISAVGHETDVTVADYVADARAATPTAAAKMAVPDQEEALGALLSTKVRMMRALWNSLERAEERMEHLRGRGRTFLLVSHSLAEIVTTCQRALWIGDGRAVRDGPAEDVCDAYHEWAMSRSPALPEA